MVQEQPPEAEKSQAAAEEERFVMKGGQDRTVFRLTIAMSRLEAAFNYEADDALPLGGISIEASTPCQRGCQGQQSLFWCSTLSEGFSLPPHDD